MRLGHDFERERIDPRGEYPSEGLRHVEELAWRVLMLAPLATVTRTRDVIQLDIGDEEGITVLVTAEAVELRLPTIEWIMGAYGPAQTSRLWKRLKAEGLDDIKLADWLDAAQQARQKEFRKCRFCGEQFPPEYRHDKNTCRGCAEKYLGVVH